MKKLLGILVLGLLWCNVGIAGEREPGNDQKGTATWADGEKYVGEFQDGERITAQGAKNKIDKKNYSTNKKTNYVYEWLPGGAMNKLFRKDSPTTFKKLTFIKERKISGVSKRQTYSARYNKKKVFRSFSFIAEYEDNITVEFFIEYEKDIKDFKKAEKKALLFSKMYGQMPLFLKTYNKKIYIHNDLTETRGIGQWWVMYDKRAFHINAPYKSEICDSGIIESDSIWISFANSSKYSQCAVTMIHELAHVIQQLTGVISPAKWLKARKLDNKKYCSKYAKKNSREDFAESMVCWIVVRHKLNKIGIIDFKKINKYIPNRLKFFDEMNFNVYPL